MSYDEDQVCEILQGSPDIEEVLFVNHSTNVYVKFRHTSSIFQIVKHNLQSPLIIDGQLIHMCYIAKLPLDLNAKSKIVLVTLFEENVEINALNVAKLFAEFGKINKVIVFKKKNYQAFLEFDKPDDASFFHQAVNNTSFKGLFFVKIQFTQKKALVIKENSLFEHDFTRHTSLPCEFPKVDITVNVIQNQINFNQFPSNENEPYYANTPAKPQVYQNLPFMTDASSQPFSHSQPKMLYSQPTFPLRVTNLFPQATHKGLFNLFSLYGNIEKISIDAHGKTAMVYFFSELDQVTSLYYLNGILLQSHLLQIEACKDHFECEYNKDKQFTTP